MSLENKGRLKGYTTVDRSSPSPPRGTLGAGPSSCGTRRLPPAANTAAHTVSNASISCWYTCSTFCSYGKLHGPMLLVCSSSPRLYRCACNSCQEGMGQQLTAGALRTPCRDGKGALKLSAARCRSGSGRMQLHWPAARRDAIALVRCAQGPWPPGRLSSLSVSTLVTCVGKCVLLSVSASAFVTRTARWPGDHVA